MVICDGPPHTPLLEVGSGMGVGDGGGAGVLVGGMANVGMISGRAIAGASPASAARNQPGEIRLNPQNVAANSKAPMAEPMMRL